MLFKCRERRALRRGTRAGWATGDGMTMGWNKELWAIALISWPRDAG